MSERPVRDFGRGGKTRGSGCPLLSRIDEEGGSCSGRFSSVCCMGAMLRFGIVCIILGFCQERVAQDGRDLSAYDGQNEMY